MIEIPDYIYERSVIKQLYLTEESRHLFQKNAYSVSINREDRETGYFAETSEMLSFKGEPVLTEKALNNILRKIMCAGGNLTELRVDIVFSGGFEEAELRKFSSSLKKLADRFEARIKRVSVYLRESTESEKTVIISGKGCLKKSSDAPWQRQRIFEGQEIILTGSVGKLGMMELFDKNKKALKMNYPEIYVEKMSNKTCDRLPYIEVEAAPFYKATAMLPLGSGGLMAGLWNLGEREEAGFVIYADRINYEQETIEISNHFNLNPLELNSKGAYLLATDRGEELTLAIRSAGIDAVCIGEVTKDKKRVVMFEDEERFIEPPRYRF